MQSRQSNRLHVKVRTSITPLKPSVNNERKFKVQHPHLFVQRLWVPLLSAILKGFQAVFIIDIIMRQKGSTRVILPWFHPRQQFKLTQFTNGIVRDTTKARHQPLASPGDSPQAKDSTFNCTKYECIFSIKYWKYFNRPEGGGSPHIGFFYRKCMLRQKSNAHF